MTIGGVASVGADRDRVRLAAHVERWRSARRRGVGGAGGQVEDVQPAARGDERLGRVDATSSQGPATATEVGGPSSSTTPAPCGCAGLVMSTNPSAPSALSAYDERAPVRARGDDLGDGVVGRVAVAARVLADDERGDALELLASRFRTASPSHARHTHPHRRRRSHSCAYPAHAEVGSARPGRPQHCQEAPRLREQNLRERAGGRSTA